MPDNEFEKQVQQKMDELQLRPSGQVWEEVEKRIRKEKKRRVVFFWLPLLALLLAGGGITTLVLMNNRAAPKITVRENEKQTTTQPGDNQPIPETENKQNNIGTTENKTIQQQTEPAATPETVIAKTAKETPGNKETLVINLSAGRQAVKNTGIKQTKARNNVADEAVIVSIIKPAIQHPDPDKKEEQQVKIPDENSVTKIDEPVTDIQKSTPADSAVAAAEKKKEEAIEIKKEEENKNEAIRLAKKSKWELGATLTIGASGRADDISLGIGLFENNKSADIGSPSGNPGLSTGPVQSPVTSVPAEPVSGFAWQVGGYAKRKFTKRTGISAGLSFASFSTTQKTGVIVNSPGTISNFSYTSSVERYYRNGTGYSYTNHYYYLQIPVSFHWQLNKGEKLPLLWQNGFTTGFLTGSDALIYSPNYNVFYRDNGLLTKVQLSFQSGVYTKLFNQSKHPLTAGILFNYHLSRLQKISSDKGNHLASFGVQLGWIIKK